MLVIVIIVPQRVQTAILLSILIVSCVIINTNIKVFISILSIVTLLLFSCLLSLLISLLLLLLLLSRTSTISGICSQPSKALDAELWSPRFGSPRELNSPDIRSRPTGTAGATTFPVASECANWASWRCLLLAGTVPLSFSHLSSSPIERAQTG